MKKLTEIRFSTEYPNIFVDNSNVFIADGGIFGKLENNFFSKIIEFNKRFEIRNLSNIYFYLDEYSGENGHLFSVTQNSFIEVIDFLVYELRLGAKNICLLTNRKIAETLLFDFEKKQILWKQDKYFSFQILENELLIDYEKNKLVRYDFQTGKTLWQYHLPETYNWQRRVANIEKPFETANAEIERLIGVFDGALYIVLNSGRIIGIDVENGQEVFTKLEPDRITIAYEKERIYTPTILWLNTQLDVENGIIFGLLGDFYAEIDLKNPKKEYRVFDISNLNSLKKIKCTNWGVWQGDEIFFGETNFASEPARIGIFNRKSKQVTWTSDELGGAVVFKGLKKIDYSGDLLYTLDNELTLHILQR